MFNTKKRNLIYILIVLVPSVLFLIKINTFSKFRFKVIDILNGPIRLLSAPIYEIKKILYYHRTFDEYIKLRKETDYLKARLIGQEEVMLENARLEKLLKFKRNLVYSSVPAKVIWRDPTNWNASIIIDRGSNDGIKLGMSVVNASGVVGKIVELDENKSKVILLTDPNFSVAAMVQGDRESGLVSGSLQGLCRMKYLDANANIKVGDKVITSKLSNSFPESILIGEVVSIYDDPKRSSVECVIAPAVSFSQIEEVLVILRDKL